MTSWERFGGVLFRARSATPVALLALVFVWPTRPGLGTPRLAAGASAALAGEAIRLWAVGVAGKHTRTRGKKVKALVTSGPFALVRNPLYIGNFLLAYGIVALSGVDWLLWAFPPLFALQYSAIVAWEERVLTNTFGERYTEYQARVGRWVPRPGAHAAAGEPRWSARVAWRSERDTLWGLAAVGAALAAKHTVLHGWFSRALGAALHALPGGRA